MRPVLGQQQEWRKRRDHQRRWRRYLLSTQRIMLVVLVWLVAIAGLFGVYSLVFMRNYFSIDRVVIEGDFRQLTREQIETLAAVPMGENLVTLPVSAIRERVLQESWAKEVAVRRKLPHTVWIYVGEHHPVAIVADTKLHYVGDDGVIFKDVEPGEKTNYPVITGLTIESSPEAFRSTLQFVRLIEEGPVEELFGVSEYHVDPVAGFSVVTAREPMLILFGRNDIKEKASALMSVAASMQESGKRIIQVDLNYDRKVVVRYVAS